MNYKIIYFAFVGANFGGVEQKIFAQFDVLIAFGKEINLFLISKYKPGDILLREIEKRHNIKILINSQE